MIYLKKENYYCGHRRNVGLISANRSAMPSVWTSSALQSFTRTSATSRAEGTSTRSVSTPDVSSVPGQGDLVPFGASFESHWSLSFGRISVILQSLGLHCVPKYSDHITLTGLAQRVDMFGKLVDFLINTSGQIGHSLRPSTDAVSLA